MATAEEILKDCGLAEIDNWETLIHCYQGNPFWLESAGFLIQELGGLAVTDLLPDDTILLPEDLKDILQLQCDRLSAEEKQILSLLAKTNQATSLAQLSKQMQLPDLANTLESLCRRCLIEKQENLYIVPPVLRQYSNL